MSNRKEMKESIGEEKLESMRERERGEIRKHEREREREEKLESMRERERERRN